MSEKQSIVTIDGPSGVGKSTVSRRVAAEIGYTYLDTGAMYRAVGLALHRANIDYGDDKAVDNVLNSIEIQLVPPKTADGDVGVILSGEDISEQIRTPEVSMLASRSSAIPAVRSRLTGMQQQVGEAGRIVAEGRDTGTVVFPEAAYKFYLDGDPQERAKRRVEQLRRQGNEADEQEILELLNRRDENDTNRTIAPLKKAEDATPIDTTNLTIDEVVSTIVAGIKKTG